MRRTLATFALLLVVLGIPLALIALFGSPRIPSLDLHRLLTSLGETDLDAGAIARSIGLVAWCLWAYLTLVVALRLLAAVISPRHNSARALRELSDRLTPAFLRRLADLAVSASIVLSVGRVIPAIATTPAANFATAHTKHVDVPTPPQAEPPRTYLVKPGDSLWEIAETELGSGFRWKEIYALNRDRHFSDGRSLEDPKLIRPGWQLSLPKESSDLHEGNAAQTPHVAPPSATAETQTEPSPIASPSQESVDDSATNAAEEVSTPHSPVVELPSGSVVAASFASGILTAQAISSLRARRRRRALSGRSTIQEGTLVSNIRRLEIRTGPGHLHAAATEVTDRWLRVHAAVPRFAWAIEGEDRVEFLLKDGQDHPTLPPSDERLAFSWDGPFVRARVSRPFAPQPSRSRGPLETGLLVSVGYRNDECIFIGLVESRTTLIGAEAAAVTQELLLSLAAASPCGDLEVFAIGDAPLAEVGQLNHVVRSSSWDDAPPVLRDLEEELLRRARLFLEEGVDDWREHLVSNPDEPLPALLIVATEPPVPLRGPIEAVAMQVSALAGAFVAVGWELDKQGQALEVSDSVVSLSNPPTPAMSELHRFGLSQDEIKQALELINQAHPKAWNQFDEPSHAPSVINVAVAVAAEGSSDLNSVTEEQNLTIKDEDEANAQTEPPELLGETVQLDHQISDYVARPSDPSQLPNQARAFGPLQLIRSGRPVVKTGRQTSRELLAFLVANRRGASRDQIIESLWPDKGIDAGQDLRNALYHLRKTTGGKGSVVQTAETWALDPDRWWVDVWEFESLIATSEEAGPEDAMGSLKQAIDLYSGAFCDDCYYSWLEPVRDEYRGKFIRASARLANLYMEFERPTEALLVLDEAIREEPINEDLYRRAITIEGQLRRRNNVIRRFNKLEAVLQDELDEDPDEDTAQLVRKVLNDLDRSQRVEA